MFGLPDGKLNNNLWELDILNIFLKAWIFERLKNRLVKSEPANMWNAGKTLQISSPRWLAIAYISK